MCLLARSNLGAMRNAKFETGNCGRPSTGFAFLISHFALFPTTNH